MERDRGRILAALPDCLPAKFVAPSGISPDTKWVSKDTAGPPGHPSSARCCDGSAGNNLSIA